MRLLIEHGTLYADNKFLCYVGAGNGRRDLPVGSYPVATQYSHAHGTDLPNAMGLGWLGASDECDVVLGTVRGRDAVVPSQGALKRLLALVEAAEYRGQTSTLVVEP